MKKVVFFFLLFIVSAVQAQSKKELQKMLSDLRFENQQLKKKVNTLNIEVAFLKTQKVAELKPKNPFDVDGGSKEKGISSSDGGRIRLTDPKIENVKTDTDLKIFMRAEINAEGEIIEISNITSATTTTDEQILEKVMSAVKLDVVYSKKPGAKVELVFITVRLNAD